MKDDPASLDRLHDVVAPAPIPAWPPTPIWYVIAAVLLVVLAVLAWLAWRRWRSHAYRRQALAELADWRRERAGRADLTPAEVGWLASLLKRTALAVAPREQVAGADARTWSEFLRRAEPGTGSPSWDWLAAAYVPAGEPPIENGEARIDEVERWLRRHQISDREKC